MAQQVPVERKWRVEETEDEYGNRLVEAELVGAAFARAMALLEAAGGMVAVVAIREDVAPAGVEEQIETVAYRFTWRSNAGPIQNRKRKRKPDPAPQAEPDDDGQADLEFQGAESSE